MTGVGYQTSVKKQQQTGLSAIKLHLKMIVPPRVFICIIKVYGSSGNRQTALFEWRDKHLSVCEVPACTCPVSAREDTMPSSPLLSIAGSQLWDELIKGYTEGSLSWGSGSQLSHC